MGKTKTKKRKKEGVTLVPKKEEPRTRKVHFLFQAPEANAVYLSGEFNGWQTQTLPMMRRENGVWNAAVELPAGRYEYKLFVDGGWMEDRPCEVVVEMGSVKPVLESESIINSYGTVNYVFAFDEPAHGAVG